MELRVALDTNRLADLFRGDKELAQRLEGCEEVGVPLIVLGEMKAGFYAGAREELGETLLRELLARSTVRLLNPGPETAERYARLFVQLKRAGTPIPQNDLWIAALVLEHDLRLITRDQHFQRIPQLLCG